MPFTKEKFIGYAQLIRINRPIGIELLLYPTLWGLFLAQYGATQNLPSLLNIILFTLGAVFMRSAGCAINDYADRNLDGKVERTKHRPLASGTITEKEALVIFGILVLFSACLLLFLPIKVFYWSFGALLLATLYPFMKRFTYLPQFVLGMAFSWAIPMTYVAVQGKPDMWCWLLYLANLCWTVAYDTQYAMTDREDDLKAGIKSTAILFGKYDLVIISLLQICFVFIMAYVLWHYFGWYGFAVLLAPLSLFIYQLYVTKERNAPQCFQAFLNNAWVGRFLFFGIAILSFI